MFFLAKMNGNFPLFGKRPDWAMIAAIRVACVGTRVTWSRKWRARAPECLSTERGAECSVLTENKNRT